MLTLGVEQREKDVNGREWMLCLLESLALLNISDPGSVSCWSSFAFRVTAAYPLRIWLLLLGLPLGQWVIDTGPVLGSLSQMVPPSFRSLFAHAG